MLIYLMIAVGRRATSGSSRWSTLPNALRLPLLPLSPIGVLKPRNHGYRISYFLINYYTIPTPEKIFFLSLKDQPIRRTPWMTIEGV